MEIKEEWTEYYVFLEELRQSGVTNMFGATPYLREEFGLGRKEALIILGSWMDNYAELIEKKIIRSDWNEKNISNWSRWNRNITFDVDGKLYVLDEGKIGTSVSNIIKLMHDNISMNDIRPIDVCDIKATLEHPAILGNFAISLGQQATVYNMPKDKEEKVWEKY